MNLYAEFQEEISKESALTRNKFLMNQTEDIPEEISNHIKFHTARKDEKS